MKNLIVGVIGLLLLVGCSKNTGEIDEVAPLPPPVYVYFAIEAADDEHVWQHFVSIGLDESRLIQTVIFDGLPHIPRQTRRYISNIPGFEAVFGYHFYEETTRLEASFVGLTVEDFLAALDAAADDDDISFDLAPYVQLVVLAFENGANNRGPYIDGAYFEEVVVTEDGGRYFVHFYVLNGDLVFVDFGAEGLAVDVLWQGQANLLGNLMLEIQDPSLFTFDWEGLSTDFLEIEIEVELFIGLIIQGLVHGPRVW